MDKKRGVLSILLIFTILLSGCNNKYKLDDDSLLTKEDMKILRKSFKDLTYEEEIRLITMQSDMSTEELVRFKDDLKRLYVEEMKQIYGSEEAAEEVFEDNFERELKGKTDQSVKVENNQNAYVYIDEDDAEDAIEDSIEDKIKEFKNDVGDAIDIDVDTEFDKDKVIVKVDLKSIKDIVVGQLTVLKNLIVDEVLNVVDAKTIEVELYLGGEHKNTFIFKVGSGWDKD